MIVPEFESQQHAEEFWSGRVICADKPQTWSSFDVVKKLKGLARRAGLPKNFKIGHAGTLDPLATGLLIICTGKMTKQINIFQGQTKEYLATFILGAQTATFDAEFGPEQCSGVRVTKQDVIQALPTFTGIIEQQPPNFSALKVKGKRAYDLARSGVQFEIPKRRVEVYSMNVEGFDDEYEYNHDGQSYNFQRVTLRITCSKGTYIRSLANDIGIYLKTNGFVEELRRTKIGQFELPDVPLKGDPFEWGFAHVA